MDPFTLGVGGIGVGLQAFGAIMGYEGAQQQNAAQQQIIKLEQQQEDVRRRFMEANARRQQMEVIRNEQRARSQALNNATNQGAQQGSGLMGGYGQIAGQTQFNLGGINLGLQSGEQMFDINANITQQKLAYAQAGGTVATAQGLTKLGGAVTTNLGIMKNLYGNFNANTGGQAINPFNYTGTLY